MNVVSINLISPLVLKNVHVHTQQKHYSNQTYSCPPRDALPWHHGGQRLVHHITVVLRGSRGALNWAPIIPRDVSFSDSRCNLFQAGWKAIKQTYLKFRPPPHVARTTVEKLQRIRRTAVREIGASRGSYVPNGVHPWNPSYITEHYGIERFKRAPLKQPQ